MAAQKLSVDREFRYIIMWFNEWSELQREDFIPVLVEYILSKSCSNVYMNGLVNSVSNVGISNKPMSLFQCRIKLFREWSCKWPSDFKQTLQDKISEIDAKVGEKVQNEIKAYNDTHSNGNGNAERQEAITVNGEAAIEATDNDDIVNAAVAVVNETEEAIMSDNRLVAMLTNETSVDDDDDNNDHNENDNANVDQESTVHLIEPAGQVQAQEEHADAIPA